MPGPRSEPHFQSTPAVVGLTVNSSPFASATGIVKKFHDRSVGQTRRPLESVILACTVTPLCSSRPIPLTVTDKSCSSPDAEYLTVSTSTISTLFLYSLPITAKSSIKTPCPPPLAVTTLKSIQVW